ncbi:tetratricopeptide repeat protein [Micromonospora sp. NBC_00421]|uniref:tetratricopeptide repeat protein n=1 Tax=Micromonospora sp. NBC_00421 TaxID=2975976 RepID=UPI002E1E5A72
MTGPTTRRRGVGGRPGAVGGRGRPGRRRVTGVGAEALHHGQRALALYRAAGHLVGEAGARNAVGWAHAQLGQYRPALDHCTQALTLLGPTDDRHGEANPNPHPHPHPPLS